MKKGITQLFTASIIVFSLGSAQANEATLRLAKNIVRAGLQKSVPFMGKLTPCVVIAQMNIVDLENRSINIKLSTALDKALRDCQRGENDKIGAVNNW